MPTERDYSLAHLLHLLQGLPPRYLLHILQGLPPRDLLHVVLILSGLALLFLLMLYCLSRLASSLALPKHNYRQRQDPIFS